MPAASCTRTSKLLAPAKVALARLQAVLPSVAAACAQVWPLLVETHTFSPEARLALRVPLRVCRAV